MPPSRRTTPVFALLALAPLLAALPAAAQRLTEERGYDYRGGDYTDFRSRGVDSCKAECRQDRRCQAYSYNLRTSTCYLKDRVGDFQRNSDTVAGVKEGAGGPLPGRPPYGGGDLSEEEGYDYRGSDYADFPTRGVAACQSECRRDRRCRAYSFNLRTGTCYLKDRVGSLQRNSETVTGAKEGGGDGYPGGGYPGRPSLSEERGWDHRGGDYDDFRARGVGACQEQCREDSRCRAYSYNLRTSTCYLKDRVGSLQRNSDTVTGSKRIGGGGPGYPGSPGSDDGFGFEEYDGFDVRGGDYHDFRARGPEECRAECRRDRRCRAYTYNLRSSTCYLKDGPIDLERRSDTVSGIRQGSGG